MTQVSTKKETKVSAINSYSDLDRAVMDIHRDYDNTERGHDGLPFLEITDELFDAILRGKGKQEKSITYESPAIRLYRVGAINQVEAEESLSADEFRNMEIRKNQERAKEARKR